MKYKSFVFSILIILFATLLPLKGTPSFNTPMVNLPLDKIAHFMMFFYLGFNIRRSLDRKYQKFVAVLLGISLGVITELLQQYIPGRNLETMDGVMDTLGVIMGCLLYPKLKTMKDNFRL